MRIGQFSVGTHKGSTKDGTSKGKNKRKMKNINKLLTVQDMSSHLLPKMDKENKMTGKKYETYEDIVESICPSKTMKQHWKDIGFRFTDAQLALMINEETSVAEEMMLLQCLRKFASPEVVTEIDNYFEYLRIWWEKFQATTPDTFYIVYYCYRVDSNHPDEIAAVTKDFSMALEVAQCYGDEHYVSIEKRQYVTENDYNEQDEEYDAGYIAHIAFTDEGYIGYFNGFCDDEDIKKAKATWHGVWTEEPFGFERFKMPYPFRKGDVVRCIGSYEQRCGIPGGAWAYVNSGPSVNQTFDEYEDECINRWGGDYSDIMVTVEIMDEDGEFEHAHINPIYLEKAEDDGGYPYKILEWTGNICREGRGYVQEVQMVLEEYRKLSNKNAKFHL